MSKVTDAKAATWAARWVWEAKRLENARGRQAAVLARVLAAGVRREFGRMGPEDRARAELWAAAVEREQRSREAAREAREESVLEDAWVAAAAREAALMGGRGRIEVEVKPKTK